MYLITRLSKRNGKIWILHSDKHVALTGYFSVSSQRLEI